MDGRKQVCPVCGQAVESVVRRHKTLGAWVPVWGPGACRNPECGEYAGSGAPKRSPARSRPQRSEQPDPGPPRSPQAPRSPQTPRSSQARSPQAPPSPGPERRPPEAPRGEPTP
nr:hypothetical protein [Streptomyces humi]